MSTSSTPSPYSAASPRMVAHASPSVKINKPIAPMAGALQTPSIITRKEWVVPPRPKPGRKPAADTPPTKRKAQNRAAQRAFRERRAARVGELEEQMKQMEEQDEKEQAELRSRIQKLEADVDTYKADVDHYNQLFLSWREKYQTLETKYERERRYRESAERKLDQYAVAEFNSTKAVSLPPRHTRHLSTDERSLSTTPGDMNAAGEEVPMGCGGCSTGTRCKCIEQAFDISNITDSTLLPSKRPSSPLPATHPKRSCNTADAEFLEIDFTAQFATRRPAPSLPTASTMPEPCGFCQDGTPCICAEMAADPSRTNFQFTAPGMHPPMTTVSSNPTKPVNTKPPNPCVNGPGTCAQCLASPNSTLFCKSLAATRSYASAQPDPAARNDSNSNMNDFSRTNGRPGPNPTEAVTGVTLSCADTFETLSRHPAFDRASEELGAWMPKLTTVPGGVERTAFEVEAASVMGVLRFFDRRFGRDS